MTSVKMTGAGPALTPRRSMTQAGREPWPELLAAVWSLEQALAELPEPEAGTSGTARDRICALRAELLDELSAQGWTPPASNKEQDEDLGDEKSQGLRAAERVVQLLAEAYDLTTDLLDTAHRERGAARSDLPAWTATCGSAIEEALLYGAENRLDELSPQREAHVSAALHARRSLRNYVAALDELDWWERHGSSPLAQCNAVLQLRLELADRLLALGWLPSATLLDQLSYDRQAADLHRSFIDDE